MIEVLVSIILLPFALGAIVFAGAIVAGVVKYFKDERTKKI